MVSSIQKPLIDIPIPDPILQLGTVPIALVYVFGAYLDYYLLCKSSLNDKQVKKWILIYHILIPIIFEPTSRMSVITYLSISWTIAVIGMSFVDKTKQQLQHQQQKDKKDKQFNNGNKIVKLNEMTFGMFMKGVGVEGFTIKDDNMTKNQIRKEGIQRCLTVISIWALARLIINPLLLDDPVMLLTMKWYTPSALYYGFIMGIKGYAVMKTNDMLLSITQVIWGIRTIQYFDLPFLATSPKDFWGRRWNKVVRNILHKHVFTGDDKKSPAVRGLLAFIISGLVHEIMMCIINRHITLEQFSFFCIQSFSVYVQIRFLPKRRMMPRIICSALTLLFIDFSAQLFLAPYLRSSEQKVIFGKHSIF